MTERLSAKRGDLQHDRAAGSALASEPALGTGDAPRVGMTSFALVTAVLLHTQCPTPEVTPAQLRDPFIEKVEREPVRVQLPSDLVDPFSRPAPARALPSLPAPAVPSDLVDPFAQRRVRAEPVPSQLSDPFTAKPATLPATSPNLSDPFAAQS